MSPAPKKPAAEKPLENIKPRRGMVVHLEAEPGKWQIMDRSPAGPAHWWLTPWDEAAEQAVHHPTHGRYRSASYREMRATA